MTKKEIADIRRLTQKKERLEQRQFVAEGAKAISEIVEAGLPIKQLYHTEHCEIATNKTTKVSKEEMSRISSLKTPTSHLAIFEMPSYPMPVHPNANELTVVLDEVQDPGNLGTIIRLADWFGISEIVCSENTADCYNPKVVQATMGAIGRVRVRYCDILNYIEDAIQQNIEVLGTFMEGDNIYTANLPTNGILVMGNEGSGISTAIASKVTMRLTIPAFKKEKVESLNVAIATSICCSELRRRMF